MRELFGFGGGNDLKANVNNPATLLGNNTISVDPADSPNAPLKFFSNNSEAGC